MKNGKQSDPVKPWVTFDNYVFSETVQEQTTAVAPRFAANPMMVTMSGIAVLTFFLGVLLTLQFTGSRAAPGAAVAPGQSAPTDLYTITRLAQDVTRQEAPDILSPVAENASALPQINDLQATVLLGLTPRRTVGKLTEEVKSEAVARATSIISRNKLRMLREGVLADVYAVETVTEDGHKRIVLKTINADLTSKSMANLLRKAAAQGKINIPASLNTANGDVDMDTLIFNLVQTSLAYDGTEAGAEAAREMSRRAFAASTARTHDVKGERVYVVEPGDSLAYISLQFYGRPSDYGKIFQANRSVLKSLDQIQIGQRLRIPG